MIKNKILIYTVIIFLAVIILGYSIYFCVFAENAKKYNQVVKQYNDLAKDYNDAAQKVCLDNIVGIPNDVLELEYAKFSPVSIIGSYLGGNRINKIQKDINTLEEIIDTLETDIRIIKRIYNPGKDWVMECLDAVEEVGACQAVSVNNDPNGMLGKEGGYTSCIYFLINGIHLDQYAGVSVVDKGTDAGGCIEVYASVEDAEARCEYLADYDSTLLYSGSYAIVGTMVVRLSYALTDEEQYYLTDRIVQEMTK